jgi:hypothetical protein
MQCVQHHSVDFSTWCIAGAAVCKRPTTSLRTWFCTRKMHSAMPLIVEYGLYIHCITGASDDHYRAVIASWSNSCPCCLCMHACIDCGAELRAVHAAQTTDPCKRTVRAYSGKASMAAMPDVFTTMDLLGPNDAKLIRFHTLPQPSLGIQGHGHTL